MSEAPVRFSIVGCGHIGKRHVEMISRHPEAEVVALCDVRPAADCGVADHNAPFFTSIEQMLDDGPETDIVTVATPNGLHGPHALAALDRGHHVVVEKPMGLHRSDCEEIIQHALTASRHVFCVMQNRYSPPSAWLKEMVTEDRLGKIHMVQINCFWNRDDRYYGKSEWKGRLDLDGGTLFTQFSHFVDIAYWLFGDVTDVQARFEDFNHRSSTQFEDSGIVTFRFTRGGLGALNFSTSVWQKNLESSMTIIAENGTIKVGGQYMNEVVECSVAGYEMPELPPSNPANDYGPYKGSAANHAQVIENVVDTVRGRSKITTSALEGMKVVEIIERFYAAGERPA